jgi:hypothetical protein
MVIFKLIEEMSEFITPLNLLPPLWRKIVSQSELIVRDPLKMGRFSHRTAAF